MKLRFKSFTLFFFILILARIFLVNIFPEFNLLLGGIICGSLLAFYIVKVKHQNPNFILYLIISMIADIILAFGKTTSIGLSFIFYGMASLTLFVVLKRAFDKKLIVSRLPHSVIVFAITSIVIYMYLLKAEPIDYKFLIYLIPVAINTAIAFNLKIPVKGPVTIGTTLVFLSACVLTLGPIYALPFLPIYLLLYGLGNFLICYGFVDAYIRANENKEKSLKKKRK